MNNKFKTYFALIFLILICLILGSCSSYFLPEERTIKSTDINELGQLIIYYTDGTFENLGVVVGKDGAQGPQGEAGKDGKDGKDGTDGTNGKDGEDGKDGINGADGSITIVGGSTSDSTQIAISKCLFNSVSIACAFTKIEEGFPKSLILQSSLLCRDGEEGFVFYLPFYFWTDLGYKELPSVKITEGSILTEHNRSINWNLPFSIYQHRSAR